MYKDARYTSKQINRNAFIKLLQTAPPTDLQFEVRPWSHLGSPVHQKLTQGRSDGSLEDGNKNVKKMKILIITS